LRTWSKIDQRKIVPAEPPAGRGRSLLDTASSAAAGPGVYVDKQMLLHYKTPTHSFMRCVGHHQLFVIESAAADQIMNESCGIGVWPGIGPQERPPT
jgi:hypothetical protein